MKNFIQKEIENFFRQLFYNSIHKLNEKDKLKCEGLKPIDECANALLEMKNQKSTGSDGKTTEFYKIFWNDIKQIYINSVDNSYENGQQTELQK